MCRSARLIRTSSCIPAISINECGKCELMGATNAHYSNTTNPWWITHETFLGHTNEVIFVHWPYALRGIRVGEDKDRKIAEFNTWHPSPSPDGSRIVCDTTCPDIGLQLIHPETGEHETLCYPRSSNGGTQWAETVPADDDKVQADTYGPQWSHPHPSFSPDGKRVIYTSDQTGSSQIYVVEVPA